MQKSIFCENIKKKKFVLLNDTIMIVRVFRDIPFSLNLILTVSVNAHIREFGVLQLMNISKETDVEDVTLSLSL